MCASVAVSAAEVVLKASGALSKRRIARAVLRRGIGSPASRADSMGLARGHALLVALSRSSLKVKAVERASGVMHVVEVFANAAAVGYYTAAAGNVLVYASGQVVARGVFVRVAFAKPEEVSSSLCGRRCCSSVAVASVTVVARPSVKTHSRHHGIVA